MSGDSCCEKQTSNDVNCKPSNAASTPECGFENFVEGGTGDSCEGEEKLSLQIPDFDSNPQCGCVPSRVAACEIDTTNAGGGNKCFIPRL